MRDSIGERRPLDELEDQRGNPSGIFESVDRSNSGMVQGSEKACLTVEPGEAIGIVGERGWQYLDGDVSTELVVTSAIDLTHAACPEGRDDPVRTDLSRGHQRHGFGVVISSLALGPHPQRELTPPPRLRFPCPRLGVAAGAHAATAEAIENLIGPELRSSSKAHSSRDCTRQQSKSQIPCSDRLPDPERHPSGCGHQDSRDDEHDGGTEGERTMNADQAAGQTNAHAAEGPESEARHRIESDDAAASR